ncbi:uncharacterized protein LOC110860174 [Folsomia candida]|uniref:uncharacterized protein LOC110860174 n=1 Tax=Folsomia candida TaxID=158441 RepID=UPI000B8FC832|nr:uncharacterized protein LOC110860174 [Folsomia candida]
MFPSLRKLSVSVSEWMSKGGEQENFLVTEFDELANLTGLTHIEVLAPFPISFAKFVDFLQYLTNFSPDVPEVRVTHCICHGDDDMSEYKGYRNVEIVQEQKNRFLRLIPALRISRNLTLISGLVLARQIGLEFRKDAELTCRF